MFSMESTQLMRARAEALGELRGHLARRAVEGLLAAEDELEALQPLGGGGDDVARRQRVRVGEGAVREQHRPVGARGHALAQSLRRGVRAHGYGRDMPPYRSLTCTAASRALASCGLSIAGTPARMRLP